MGYKPAIRFMLGVALLVFVHVSILMATCMELVNSTADTRVLYVLRYVCTIAPFVIWGLLNYGDMVKNKIRLKTINRCRQERICMNICKKYALMVTAFTFFTMLSIGNAPAPPPPVPVGGTFSSVSISILAVIGVGIWLIARGKSNKGDK